MELGEDEIAAMIGGAFIGGTSMYRWYGALFVTSEFPRPRPGVKMAFALLPLALSMALYPILIHWGSHEIREEFNYVILFWLAGLTWIGLANGWSSIMGISFREDVIVRRNPAAGIAFAAAVIGIYSAFALTNIGEGDSIWMTIVPATGVTATLFFLWLVVELSTHIGDAITLDRDRASALRFGGFLIGAGLVLGRSVAGDYGSAENMMRKFITQSWPAAVLAVICIVLHRLHRPTPQNLEPSRLMSGWIPGLILAGSGLAWVFWLGSWK
jgi:hypothetical protein